MMFEGTATALITPFTNDGIDINAFERILDFQIENGVNALVVLGTTGEPATMSKQEKDSIIRTAVHHANGRLPVIVGAGSNSTRGAIEACANAQDLGADGVLVVTPYYNKCTQEGLVEHYEAIAQSTSLSIICYNVPSRTGVNLLPSTFEKLAHIKNIVGVKEASGNMEQIEHCIRVANKYGKAVFSGDDALTVPVMATGGRGVISVASNAYPKFLSQMTDYALKGMFKDASAMQLALLPLIGALFSEVNPIPIKRAMQELGLCDGQLRLPLTRMTENNAKILLSAMQELTNSQLYREKMK